MSTLSLFHAAGRPYAVSPWQTDNDKPLAALSQLTKIANEIADSINRVIGALTRVVQLLENLKTSLTQQPAPIAERRYSPREQALINELRAIDRHVRQHEDAHLKAAGDLALGPPRFTYRIGPDGNRYAVGGSVMIDTSPGRTPEETLARAQRVRAAALAPNDPSDQDRRVAAEAERTIARSEARLRTLNQYG